MEIINKEALNSLKIVWQDPHAYCISFSPTPIQPLSSSEEVLQIVVNPSGSFLLYCKVAKLSPETTINFTLKTSGLTSTSLAYETTF